MKLHEMPKYKPSARMDVDPDNPREDMQFLEDSPFLRGDFCPKCGVMLPFHKNSCQWFVPHDQREGATYQAQCEHVRKLARATPAICKECHGVLPEHSNKCSKRTCKECKCSITLGHSFTCSQHPSNSNTKCEECKEFKPRHHHTCSKHDPSKDIPCETCGHRWTHAHWCKHSDPVLKRLRDMEQVMKLRGAAYNPEGRQKMTVMGPTARSMAWALERENQKQDEKPFNLRVWSKVMSTFGHQIPGCHYRKNVSNQVVLRWHRSSVPKDLRELMKSWYCDCGEHSLDWNQPIITKPAFYEKMRRFMLIARLADGSKVGVSFEHGTVTRVLNHEKRVYTPAGFRKVVVPETIERESTHCRLYAIEAEDKVPTLIADGYVVRNFKDKHSPKEARKWAIRKALSAAWPNAQEAKELGLTLTSEQLGINRHSRRKVWEVYKGRGKN